MTTNNKNQKGQHKFIEVGWIVYVIQIHLQRMGVNHDGHTPQAAKLAKYTTVRGFPSLYYASKQNQYQEA